MHDRPVRHLETPRCARVGLRIEQPGQLIVSARRVQWPAELKRFRPAQELLNGADTNLGAGPDLPYRQIALVSQSKNISDFSHRDPLA